MLLLTVIILLIAASMLYGCNKHQRLFKKPLKKAFKPIAYLLILGSFGIAIFSLQNTAAVFFCIFILMLALLSVSFICLINAKESSNGRR